MIIGLDIDNVIADLDKTLLEEFLKEDKNKRNKGIIDPTAEHMTQGMFDWSHQEIHEFLDHHLEQMTANLDLVEDAKTIIDQLKKDGHKIYLITGRNATRFSNPEELTKKWLEEKGVQYDKLIFTQNSTDKSLECSKYKVDIMFDDRPMNCIKLQEKGIQSYLFKTRYNWRYSLNVPMVDSWKDLYKLIKEISKNGIN